MESTQQKTSKLSVIIYFHVDNFKGAIPKKNSFIEDVEGAPPSILEGN